MIESAAQERSTGTETVKHIPLSSRQRLCINPSVSRIGSLSAINDRCAELQQPKTKEKCPFVPNADNLSNTHRFRDTALATLPDIEDMFQIGKTLQVCPYYASRTAIPGAEVITLPYPLLLQKSARDALGIKLEGNVVIIDEAHNIMDAVSNVYAAEIRLGELRKARQALGVYVKRFGKKLKGENRVMVAQVVRVVDSLSEWLDGAIKAKVGEPSDLQYLRADIHHRQPRGLRIPTCCSKARERTSSICTSLSSTSRSQNWHTRSRAMPPTLRMTDHQITSQARPLCYITSFRS